MQTTLSSAQERVALKLRRHGVGDFNARKPANLPTPHKPFNACEPGYLGMNMDIRYPAQMANEF